MKYKLDFSPKVDVSAPSVSGALVGAQPAFVAWQPSTWPVAPASVNEDFICTLKRIFEESILGEISNVIDDALTANGDLQHRGHVVAISLMCALDAISSYGYGLLRSDEHYVAPRIAPEARHRREMVLEPLTVARFEGLSELLDCVACDLLCLIYFHFSCPPVSGSLRSLHPQPRERGRETGDRSGEIGASRSKRAARLSDTVVRWREAC